VTGAGRGIGEGIAHTLAAAGAGVVCAARRAEEIEKVAADIRERGGKAISVATDVTDDAAVENLAKAAIGEFGRLDIWVNNAGGSPVARRLTKLSREDWDAAIAVNLTSVWVCSVIAERHMEDGGAILNISSRAGAQATPGSGHYAAAKAGVDNLTATMAHEVGPRIRVNGIAPGAVPTEIMMKALRISEEDLPELEKRLPAPMRRLGTPEDLGAAALFLVSPASSWITGVTLPVSGGL
jgi:NAD(P)-dependent dehydrogenase (short-subunit alcohol dehydrogenase family)